MSALLAQHSTVLFRRFGSRRASDSKSLVSSEPIHNYLKFVFDDAWNILFMRAGAEQRLAVLQACNSGLLGGCNIPHYKLRPAGC